MGKGVSARKAELSKQGICRIFSEPSIFLALQRQSFGDQIRIRGSCWQRHARRGDGDREKGLHFE